MKPRWPRWVLIGTLLTIALSLWSISHLRPDTSLEALFASNDPAAAAMVRVLNGYRSVEELIILATAPQPDPAKLETFAANLQTAIAEDPQASKLSAGVIWRTDAQMQQFFQQVLIPSALFYLNDADFAAAQNRLSTAQIFQQIKQDRAMLATPGPAAQALSKTILLDPLHLHELIMDRLAQLRPLKTYQNSDAFLSPDGRSILIRIRGRRPVSDLQFSHDFTEAITRIANQINNSPEILTPSPSTQREGRGGDNLELRTQNLELSPPFHLSFTGSYAIASASQSAIRSDIISSTVGSIVFLQALFLLAYRRPIASFLLAISPIVVGILLGFAVYALLKTTFTPVSAAIGGILAGMGIDYSVQFLSQNERYRAHSSGAAAALYTVRLLWPAVLAAWITSLIGFASIGSANVRALRDFSLMGSLGLTGACLASLTILPALLAIFVRNPTTSKVGTLRPFLTNHHFIQLIARAARPLATIGLLILFTALVIFILPGKRLSLDPDLSALNPQPNPAIDAEKQIQIRMGASPQGMICYLHADSPAALLHLSHDAGNRLRRIPGITGTFGLDSLLPDPNVTKTRLQQLDPKLADRVIADLRAALQQNGFRYASFSPYADFLRKLITNRTPPTISDLLHYPTLAENILPATATEKSLPTDAITYVFTGSQSTEQDDHSIESIRLALSNLPSATLTGLGVLSHDAEANVARQLPRLISLALAIIAAYLLIHFRNLSDLILSLLPTIFSLACVLAFARLTHARLNIINLVAFPLLIGIDVDYGVFLISAARKSHRRNLSKPDLLTQIHPAFSAVLVCAAATILGFASLLFTTIPAIHSLGLLVSLGLLTCTAAIVLLVIPLLQSGW